MTTDQERSDEVPEADALEQERELIDDGPAEVDPDALEVPEADAIEQRQSLEPDDEEWSR